MCSYCKGENHNVRGCLLKKAGINPEDYVTEDLVAPISTAYGTGFQVNCYCSWSCTTANCLSFKLFWWHAAICKHIGYPRISVCRPGRSTKFSGINWRPWRTYCYGISIWAPDTNWWCTNILPADVKYELDHVTTNDARGYFLSHTCYYQFCCLMNPLM